VRPQADAEGWKVRLLGSNRHLKDNPHHGSRPTLGGIAILYGQFWTLKEWAYAGHAFNLFGASGSHVFSGHGFRKIIVAVIIPGFVLASYRPSKNPLDLREH
jgi:hypothetical protein